MSSVTRLGEEMKKKISISDSKSPPSKKNSTASGHVLSSSSSKVGDVLDETPPRKKSSLKENISAAFRSPVNLVRREASKARWEQVRERLKLTRVKISMRDRKRKASKSRERRRRSNENQANGNGSTPPTSANNMNMISPNNIPSSPRLSPNEWQFAFDHVIYDVDGRAQFTKFLQSEYSEENILFWWAVEELKAVGVSEGRGKFESTVQEMYDTFIAAESPLAINIDHDTRTDIIGLVEGKEPSTFPENIYERAQAHVYRLMEKDCFSRFVHTNAYKDVAKKLSLPQTFRFNGLTKLHPGTAATATA